MKGFETLPTSLGNKVILLVRRNAPL